MTAELVRKLQPGSGAIQLWRARQRTAVGFSRQFRAGREALGRPRRTEARRCKAKARATGRQSRPPEAVSAPPELLEIHGTVL